MGDCLPARYSTSLTCPKQGRAALEGNEVNFLRLVLPLNGGTRDNKSARPVKALSLIYPDYCRCFAPEVPPHRVGDGDGAIDSL